MVGLENRGYNKDIFLVSKASKEIALIPGLGKFCRCGCNKPIEGKIITQRTKSGREIKYFRKPYPDQIFASRGCKTRHYNRIKGYQSRRILKCIINLIPNDDQTRTLTIYLTKGKKEIFTISHTQKRLWTYLEKISKFRGYTK